MSGDAVATRKGGRKKRVLLILGLLAGGAAAAMAVMKKSAPKDDPWTTPLADRYDETPSGRHSATSLAEDATGTATSTKSEIIDAVDESDGHNPTDQSKDPALDETGDTSKGGPKAGTTKVDAGKVDAKKGSASKNGSDRNPLT
jgi:hypothetical protein